MPATPRTSWTASPTPPGPAWSGPCSPARHWRRSLAFALGIPALGVHHLEGHLLAPLLERDPPPFPHVALLVSGGHTMLIEVQAHRRLPAAGSDPR